MSSSYTGPINPNPKDGEAGISIYGYVPSLALAIVGAVTFAIVLALHGWQASRWRGTRSFHILMAVGSLMEVGGYAARAYSNKHPFMVSAFVAQYFLIVVAPVLFAAAIYYSLSYAINRTRGGHTLIPIKPRTVLICFIISDTVTTIIQVAGAALVGVTESKSYRGEPIALTPEDANHILLAGLAIQTFSFVIFLSILAVTIKRTFSYHSHEQAAIAAEHDKESAGYETDKAPIGRKLKTALMLILGTSLLVLLRTVFRLAETASGLFSYASTHEFLFGILEYMPVIIAIGLWALFPLARFFHHNV